MAALHSNIDLKVYKDLRHGNMLTPQVSQDIKAFVERLSLRSTQRTSFEQRFRSKP
jgi:hypothetical protein